MNGQKKFFEFTEICKQIEKISSLSEMKSIISEFLKTLDGEDLEIAARFLIGKILPGERELGIGLGLLNSALSAASGESIESIKELEKKTGDIGLAAKEALSKKAKKKQTTFASFAPESHALTIAEVYKLFEDISKATGKNKKVKILQYLFSSATPEEAIYLARLAMQELHIGVGEGVLRDAIAQAFNASQAQIERAYMLTSDLGLAAKVARNDGDAGLERLTVMLFRPVKMMLAQVAQDISEAIEEIGEVAVEWKYNGARVQIHKKAEAVAIYSRRLEDVTDSFPDIVALLKYIVPREAILEGELIAIANNGKPRPFQDILKRFRRKRDVLEMVAQMPLSLKLFDILYIDGKSLIDLPLRERRRILENSLSRDAEDAISIGMQIVTSNVNEVEKIYAEAIAAGHEGIMLKDLNSAYTPGKRGRQWLKHKPESETLDLVVIGAEWGEGRRAHLLSSYILACRDQNTGELLSIGKIGIGMSDEMLADLTETLEESIIPRTGREVDVKPMIVFEVGYEEIQKNPGHPSGYALRFPRLISIRHDKTAEEADTIDKVEQIYLRQRLRRAY